MSTLERRKLVNSYHPPREIAGQTKARRQWLESTLRTVLAAPLPQGVARIEAKVVGQGSYQSVSEYHITLKEGRTRYRGTCQVCGRSHVVQDQRVVLHGYERPGYGYIEGQCPGQGEKAAEFEVSLTKALIADARRWVSAAQALADRLHQLAAQTAYPTDADWAIYHATFVEVVETHPVTRRQRTRRVPGLTMLRHGRTEEANRHASAARGAGGYADDMTRHVLSRLGKPLRPEVVL